MIDDSSQPACGKQSALHCHRNLSYTDIGKTALAARSSGIPSLIHEAKRGALGQGNSEFRYGRTNLVHGALVDDKNCKCTLNPASCSNLPG